VYHVLLPDGRTQIVEYEADEDGYKPKITYTDPVGGYAGDRQSGNGYGGNGGFGGSGSLGGSGGNLGGLYNNFNGGGPNSNAAAYGS